MSRAITYARGSRRYRIEERRGNSKAPYLLSRACNCSLGPHWHGLSWHSTIAKAEAALVVIEPRRFG